MRSADDLLGCTPDPADLLLHQAGQHGHCKLRPPSHPEPQQVMLGVLQHFLHVTPVAHRDRDAVGPMPFRETLQVLDQQVQRVIFVDVEIEDGSSPEAGLVVVLEDIVDKELFILGLGVHKVVLRAEVLSQSLSLQSAIE